MAQTNAGVTKGNDYKPYVPVDTDMRELTLKAILLGIVLAVILGAANAYLGLKAGMTVAATFPAAVISMAVLRLFKGTILEENMARTTGAVGEALAAGAIFTIPAFIIAGVWEEFHYFQSTILMLVGGILGVLFVIILRRALIEDKELPYPESKACAEIVKIGQSGSSGAGYVFGSMLLAGIIEFFKNANGITIIKDHIEGMISFGASKIRLLDSNAKLIAGGEQAYQGQSLLQSPSASPAFVGVGYIIGFRLAAITISGGIFGWLFLMPIVLLLMGNYLGDIVGGSDWIALAKSAYNATVKPVAVGGMLVGAFYTLLKMRNSLVSGIKKGIADIGAAKAGTQVARTDKDAPFGLVFVAIGALVICMVILYQWFSGGWGSGLLAAVVMAIAGFIFAAVAGYLVGIIGSSSNPISGLTLSTLLIAALLMLLVGLGGKGDAGIQGIAATLAVASVVCCVAGVAGDMMQDWKVGHILGGTPYRMQIGGTIGVVAAALVLVLPIMWLHQANTIGSDALPAPQAGLMAMMSSGIISGEMAWPLVIAGMLFAVALILLNSPSPMLISVGMYLPFTTTFAIFIGGIFKFITEKIADGRIDREVESTEVQTRLQNEVAQEIETELPPEEVKSLTGKIQEAVAQLIRTRGQEKLAQKKEDLREQKKSFVESAGLLISSGLVAGEALVGIILAILVVSNIKLNHIVGNVDSAYVINPPALEQMIAEGVPATVADKLEILADAPVIGEETFSDTLKAILGPTTAAENQALIMKHTPQDPPAFKITKPALRELESEAVPATVINQLRSLQDQVIIGKQKFSDQLEAVIGVRATSEYKELIEENTEHTLAEAKEGFSILGFLIFIILAYVLINYSLKALKRDNA